NLSGPAVLFLFQYSVHHQHLHSFPTRRSSDLRIQGDGIGEVVPIWLLAALVDRVGQGLGHHDDIQVVVGGVGDNEGLGALIAVDGLGAIEGEVDVFFWGIARREIGLGIGVSITGLVGVAEVRARVAGIGHSQVKALGHVVGAALDKLAVAQHVDFVVADPGIFKDVIE